MKDAKDKEGRSVKILGRAGVLYKDKEGEFFVDSERLIRPPSDLVIYTDNIRHHKDSNFVISEEKKKDIILQTVKLFESIGMIVEVG